MALPVILVNSTGGSDSAASGAGPATALTGTSASYSTATVTLDGSPDLTNVATDGSHVLYLVTSSSTRFFKITAKDNGAKTVTVTPNPAGTSSGLTWAIGGKRASIGSTSSRLLFEQAASANGDLMPGWTIEMQSGHTETITSRITWRRSGDTTSGPCLLRGEAGGTRPVLTANFDDILFNVRNGYQQMRFFEAVHTGSATAATFVDMGGSTGPGALFDDIKLITGWRKGFNQLVGCTVIGCTIGNTSNDAISNTASTDGTRFINNYIYSAGAAGIVLNGVAGIQVVVGNIISGCTTQGIQDNCARGDQSGGVYIAHNDINSCGGSTISGYVRTASASNGCISSLVLLNNYFRNNGKYGIEFLTSGTTEALLLANGTVIRGNAYHNNTTGTISISNVESGAVTGADPDNASYGTGGDFSKGSSFAGKAAGYPSSFIGGSSATRSYADIGAAQRQESGGSSGGVVVPNLIYGAEGLRVFA